jgi:DNA-binding response OmpR family regulator
MLVADDRRFRALASALLSQRGYTVIVRRRGDDIAELAARESADVVLIDASASLTAAAREVARLASLHPSVGIVAVSAEDQNGLAALPVLPKWDSFDAVLDAIDRARAESTRVGATSDAR